MPPTSSRPWAVLQHVPFEGPGALAPLAAARGIHLLTCALYNAEPLPAAGELGGLIVMGGPMGVYEADRHPHLLAEMALIRAAVEQDLPLLGICLGAQLMAEALGGHVYKGPELEAGAGQVHLTAAGKTDPVFSVSADPMPVMHWHQDTFTLPPGAVHLAATDLYPHQAFRAGHRAYGLQFHIEADETLAENWAPHLPAGIRLDESGRAAIAANGRQVLARFLDLGQAEE